ncbi:MAG: hypothetical protein HY791_24800 [Deltaproteobacteria bacterium]|nr:hypothetical protein [Deltaproteobacteria bacterium]
MSEQEKPQVEKEPTKEDESKDEAELTVDELAAASGGVSIGVIATISYSTPILGGLANGAYSGPQLDPALVRGLVSY